MFENTIGAGGFGVFVHASVAVESLLLVIALVYIARGILADRRDTLLIGAFAGLLSALLVDVVRIIVLGIGSVEPVAAWWMYPFSPLLGAALARANGNLRTP